VRRPGTELRAVVQHERLCLAEPRAERKRGTGSEAVLAGSGALGVRGIGDEKLGQAVRRSQGADRSSRSLSEGDTASLGRPIANGGERGDVVRFDAGDARVDACRNGVGRELAETRDEHVVCSRGDRDVWRRSTPGPRVVHVGTGSAVDRIEGIVNGHVRHRIQARLGRPWPFGGDACGDRRFARTCVPRRDRIGRRCRSRLSSASRRTHAAGDERSHREHERDPSEDVHRAPAFVSRRAPATSGPPIRLKRVSSRLERSGRQTPRSSCALSRLSHR
jgi:hypothetical protein